MTPIKGPDGFHFSRRPSRESSDSIRLEMGRSSASIQGSVSSSTNSAAFPLLDQDDDSGLFYGDKDKTFSQKIHLASENLSIVASGFTTSKVGSIVYYTACFLSFGFCYLLFRYLPRWRTYMTQTASPLGRCEWVLIEVGLRDRSEFTSTN